MLLGYNQLSYEALLKYLILSNLIQRLKIPNRFKINRIQTKNKNTQHI